jgi:LPXTG-motif cell wall-anchored protein
MSGASGSTSYSSSSSAYVHSGASNVYLYKRVVVNPTYQYTIKNSPRITAGDSVVNVTATKTWTDDDSSGTKHQNDTVIVHLLDEEGNYLDNQYGTKELTASNNWTDTWENLPDAIYTVEEEIPDGYTSSATCTQNNTKTIFVPVTEIVNGGTYVIGSQYSSYYYNLWNASESSAKITTNRQRITTTSTTIGGVTYSNYLTNIPENEQWTFSEDAGTTLQGYETYRIQNVALSQYLHHNSDKYLDVSASSTLIYKDGYMFGISMKLTSGDYILRYFYDSGSNIYRYSNSTSGTSYYLFQKVSETDYTYTIQNAPKQDTDTIKSDEKYSKRIDALRDEQDNQDTDVDDDSEQDLTDLYRLYLDIGPMELNQGVDLLLVIDESKSMTTTSTYQNESLTRAEILTRILNGSSTEMTDDGLIQEFLSLNSKNRIGIEIFSGNKPAGGTGYTYIADITENTDADKTDEENEKRQSLLGTWFDDLNDFVEVIPQDFGSGSGTNYSAALLGARDMFNQLEDNGNKKVMVFLSDGVPTYYTNEDGTSRGGNGASRLCNTVLCKQPSIASFDSFHEMFPDVTTYTVGFATSISDEREDANPAVLRYMANVGGGDYIEADDGDALIAALEKYILGGGKYTGVSITDELSDYVDIAEQPDYKLTMTTVDGETITLWEKKTDASGNAVKDSDGNDIYEVTEAGENIIQSVTYDSKTQTVKATFYPDYALEVDAVYELSFNVNTSEFAYELTSANNQKGLDSYTDMEGTAKEGDATTDYKENDTSSLHPGFRSNKLAFVDYVQEGISQQLEYLHPVVQTSDRKQTEYELPMTGGIGTKWFTVTGFAIILGASAMFVWLTEINKHAHRSRRKRKIT